MISMISVVLSVIMVISVSGQSPVDLADLVFSLVGTVNSFDGPSYVSHASTTPTLNIQPTLEKMQYYSNYSFAAYCGDSLKDLSCIYCQNFKNDINGVAIVSNELFHTMGFITVSNSRKEIVVTFRGTEADLRNYLEDALLFNTNINNVKFHNGFYIAVMSIYKEVVECVGSQLKQHSTYKIVINGHSLGGAMGRLFLYLLVQASQFPEATYELYTVGEPRVGNKAFADIFNNLNIVSARTVNGADVVPHAPPTSILNTNLLYDYYVHPQLEFWINNVIGTQFCNPNRYEDPYCSTSLSPNYNSADHSTYFGRDAAGTCVEPAPTGAIPVTNPPPLPTRITNFANGALKFLFNIIG